MYKRKNKLFFFLVMMALTVLAIGLIDSVSAVDITIGPNTPGGLKKAVESAKGGETIYLEDGVYTGANNRGLVINTSINIQGKSNNVVIDAQQKDRLFNIKTSFSNEISVTLKNLKFKNGNASGEGGAIRISSFYCRLNIISCTFTNNKAENGGAFNGFGATSISYSSVNNCTFINNTASSLGGAINGASSVDGSTFINNKAFHGGAIYRTPSVNNCSFRNNKAIPMGIGGAIYIASSVKSCTFINNTANDEGGATSEVSSVESCIFINNTAKNHGGAISGTPSVKSCTFINNKANGGGAIYSIGYGHTMNIISCSFTNNKANVNGGAVIFITSGYKVTGFLKIEKSKFKNNIAGKKYNAIATVGNVKFTKFDVSVTPKDGNKVAGSYSSNNIADLTIAKITKKYNTYTVYIKNIGKKSTGNKFYLGVFDGTKQITRVLVNSLGAGKSTIVKVLIAKKYENKLKTFKVDSTNRIKESNKKNNLFKVR